MTLQLHYNVQPWVGLLTWTQGDSFGGWKAMDGGRSDAFEFPALKGKKPEARKEQESEVVVEKSFVEEVVKENVAEA